MPLGAATVEPRMTSRIALSVSATPGHVTPAGSRREPWLVPLLSQGVSPHHTSRASLTRRSGQPAPIVRRRPAGCPIVVLAVGR